MCYDSARGRVLLFGGTASTLWEWDGMAWLPRTSSVAPSPRVHHAMAYDEARQVVVLFGGRDPFATTALLGDTWEWNGTSWSRRSSNMSPSARAYHAMTYDVARRCTVLFGGGAYLQDVWEWEGSAWTPRKGKKSGPSGSIEMALAYDTARRECLLFGGDVGSPVNETWRYGEARPRPMVTSYGASCLGSAGPPLLAAGIPFIGNPAFAVDLLAARPFSVAALALSFGAENLQLGGGCSLYVRAPVQLIPAASNTGGFATWGLPLPNAIALRGTQLRAQALVIDPLGGFGGFAFTHGLTLALGE